MNMSIMKLLLPFNTLLTYQLPIRIVIKYLFNVVRVTALAGQLIIVPNCLIDTCTTYEIHQLYD